MIVMPQFPLNMVVFPEESFGLHIFEARYIALINEVREHSGTFGILPYFEQKIMDMGTEVELLKVVERFDDGRMNIRCRGIRTYDVKEFRPVNPEEGYSSAVVERAPREALASLEKRQEVHELMATVVSVLNTKAFLQLQETEVRACHFVHKVGLDIDQEYKLLSMRNEDERLNFLIDHINTLIPKLKEAEEVRRKIQMNGHFKFDEPLDF